MRLLLHRKGQLPGQRRTVAIAFSFGTLQAQAYFSNLWFTILAPHEEKSSEVDQSRWIIKATHKLAVLSLPLQWVSIWLARSPQEYMLSINSLRFHCYRLMANFSNQAMLYNREWLLVTGYCAWPTTRWVRSTPNINAVCENWFLWKLVRAALTLRLCHC